MTCFNFCLEKHSISTNHAYEALTKHELAMGIASRIDSLIINDKQHGIKAHPAALKEHCSDFEKLLADKDQILGLYAKVDFYNNLPQNYCWLLSPKDYYTMLKNSHYTNNQAERLFANGKLLDVPVLKCRSMNGLNEGEIILGDFGGYHINFSEDFVKITKVKNNDSNYLTFNVKVNLKIYNDYKKPFMLINEKG